MSLMMLPLKLLLCLLCLSITCKGYQQGEYLSKLIHSKSHEKASTSEELEGSVVDDHRHYLQKVYVDENQFGLKEHDKVNALPGQPDGVDFDQYAGYVTVNDNAGRALFYYFVESPHNSSTNPLLLWLNGGPGCSSFGYGGMQELGPFRVKSDGKTLYRNGYAWNNVANVIFLESPAGVGFSYSNNSDDVCHGGDTITALDSYTFLLNWLERFPQYKTRDFFISGESYAGHYVPQLASTILLYNKLTTNRTIINLKGIAIGNAWMDRSLCDKGMYDYFWTHGLISDEIHAEIETSCDFESGNYSIECKNSTGMALNLVDGVMNVYNIYGPLCGESLAGSSITTGGDFDPCSEDYTASYLNLNQVKEALHANTSTSWEPCSFNILNVWSDTSASVLPTINSLISSGISIWLYSGDIDGRVPITASKYMVNALKLPVETAWRPWYSDGTVGGYVVGYKGLALVTVRGAGHGVPSYQPQRALTMISSFFLGELPPPKKNK